MAHKSFPILADHLLARRSEILHHVRARMCATGPCLSEETFPDHLPLMLDRLDDALRGRQNAPPDDAAPAREHGEQRRQAGYAVDQLLNEMGDLQAVLIEEAEAFYVARPRTRLSAVLDAAREIAGFIMREAARSAEEFTRADAVEQGRARMHAVVAQMPLAVLVTDASARILQLNAAARRMLGDDARPGASLEEICQWPAGEAGEPAPWEETPVARALRGETVEGTEGDVRLPDGRHSQCLFHAGPIHDADGKVTGAVVACQDISRLKHAEEALREADRSKDRFLALLAHELRNPVSAILGAADILRQGPAGRGDALATLDRNARNIERLLEDLLDVARFTQGKARLDLRPLRLDQVTARVVAAMEPRAREKGLTVTADLEDGVWIQGDAFRVEQILSNLVGNALKYTQEGGVRVTARREEDEAVVAVLDTGIGIAPDVLPTVFDMFMQAEDALPLSGGGMGMGLPIARSFTELHGGTLTAHSDGAGTGATFTARFPAISPEAEAAPARGTGPDAKGSCRVLLVDDHADAREILRDILEMDGYEVDEAADGPAALASVQSHEPDVVLLDIGLPGLDGYEVARRLRARPELTGVRLVALTGYGQPADRERSAESGFDAHLTKPVDLAALRDLLATLC